MGTSVTVKSFQHVVWDHPHAYGDKQTVGTGSGVKQGSSPRVWGQGYHLRNNLTRLGIIPTRMGTRQRNARKGLLLRDHPHAYGDKCKGRETAPQ